MPSQYPSKNARVVDEFWDEFPSKDFEMTSRKDQKTNLYAQSPGVCVTVIGAVTENAAKTAAYLAMIVAEEGGIVLDDADFFLRKRR